MPATLEPVALVELPANKTAKFRSATLTRNGEATGSEYSMIIFRDGEATPYQVDEQPPVAPGRVFVVAKFDSPFDDVPAEVYETRVGPNLAKCSCTCPGGTMGRRNGPCCHILALKSFVDAGHLEHPAS